MRVLHLVGSPTSEFFADLSRLYAADCLRAVDDPQRYEAVIAYVTPDGRWRFPDDLSLDALAAAPSMPIAEAIARLVNERIDVAVPQLFCRAGMTSYRALLELLDIPFVGNRPDVMAVGADKQRCRAIVAAAGVDVPDAEVVEKGGRLTLPLPVVVKPVDADNSAGVTLVREPARFDAALAEALAHSSQALVESYVELGREVRCGVLERGDDLVVLPLEEYAVDPVHKPVRDAADKLTRRGDGELQLVAKDDEHAWPVGAAALAAHRALDCRHYSLFDFRIDPDGRPWFLEAGLYCSFAPTSVIAVMAAAAGTTLDSLFAEAVTAARRM